ncbi:hypothetical protein H8959_007432 [Pygathrix nigripes]
MAAPARAGTVIAAPDRRRWLWSVLKVALGLLTAGVSALEAYTPKEIFMANGQVYLGNYPPFKDRISWAEDLDKKDASINTENMQSIHNGTYSCDVKNPPDIVFQSGHIRLYVVEKESLPVFPVWVVGGIVTTVILGLTLLISMILAVLYRRKNSKRGYIREFVTS